MRFWLKRSFRLFQLTLCRYSDYLNVSFMIFIKCVLNFGGARDEANKIHCGSWKKLCRSKDLGGLGFRDLSIFNQVMLAKQVWRLVHFPNSLAGKVLKHCYFLDTYVMQASESFASSFLWKSLLWGKSLLDAGSRWPIGSGDSMLIYHHWWLPCPTSFKVQSPPLLGNLAKVNSLKLPSGCWNASLIWEVLWPSEAKAILDLPCVNSYIPDSLLWHFDKFGTYSVRSGYHFGCVLESESSTSGLSLDNSWWKFLWCLKIPNKIKVLI